jgi:hypothetical protein
MDYQQETVLKFPSTLKATCRYFILNGKALIRVLGHLPRRPSSQR